MTDRTFDTESDAVAYAAKVSPGSVRFVSHCRVCDTPCAVSAAARWSIVADLFGVWHVERVEEARPDVDPCGHGRRRWSRVTVSPSPGQSCGKGCEDASSAFCNCSCSGSRHGLTHRPRNV